MPIQQKREGAAPSPVLRQSRRTFHSPRSLAFGGVPVREPVRERLALALGGGGGSLGVGLGLLAVDALLELLARLEERDALGHHRDHLAGLRVQPLASVAALDDEAAEAADLDAFAARQ